MLGMDRKTLEDIFIRTDPSYEQGYAEGLAAASEHEHNRVACDECNDLWERGYDVGYETASDY